MNNPCSCKCKYNCTLLAFIASLIIGIVTAFLRITAVITITPAFLWTLFGISVGYLLLTQTASVFIRDCGRCVRETLSSTLFGVLLTALLSVVLLGVTFVATSIVGAILTGLLLFAISFTLSSGACLTKCLACSDD